MLRARQTFNKSLPVAARVAAGVLLSALLAGGTATVAEAAAQDLRFTLQTAGVTRLGGSIPIEGDTIGIEGTPVIQG